VKRKRLAELVREEAETLQEASTPKEERAEEAPPAQASPPGGGPGERPLPPYLTYVRKECRLRPDQLDALTALARRLNRERKGKGERITENTLIRWAVDMLISHLSQDGFSEASAPTAQENDR
jgi:pyruvate/2-oxoglutarate dehydrogenase complex dihydrolipoamide acyltransferase (E2) component